MKGIVVEIHNHTAAVLSEDGCVVKMRNNNYQIGQEVVCMKKQIIINKKMIAIASTAASFLIILGISAYTYFTPYAYVTLDVNPSIEYSLNRFDKVLTATGVNDDGTDIINEADLGNLKNKSIEDAVSLTIDKISDAGYFDSEEGGIVITTSSDNKTKADELAKTLEGTANTGLENNHHEGIVTAEAVGLERVNEAKELGVTPGKLNIVEKLMESAGDSENIDRNEWLNKSVKDIMAQTKKYKEQNKEKKQNAGEETQNQEQNENQEMNGGTEIIGTTNNQSDTSDSEDSNKSSKQNNKKNGKESSDTEDTATDPNTDSDNGNTAAAGSNASSNSDSDKGNSSAAGSNASSDSDSDKGNSSAAGSNASSNSDSDKGNSSTAGSNANSNSDSDKGNSSAAGSNASSNSDSDKGNSSAGSNAKSNSGSDNGNLSNMNKGKKGN